MPYDAAESGNSPHYVTPSKEQKSREGRSPVCRSLLYSLCSPATGQAPPVLRLAALKSVTPARFCVLYSESVPLPAD